MKPFVRTSIALGMLFALFVGCEKEPSTAPVEPSGEEMLIAPNDQLLLSTEELATDQATLARQTEEAPLIIDRRAELTESVIYRATKTRTRPAAEYTEVVDASSSSSESEIDNCPVDLFLECGKVYRSSTLEDVYDVNDELNFNVCDNDFYADYGLQTDLNGSEKVFFLFVKQPAVYSFRLTGATRNLAMVLFQGSVNCNISSDRPNTIAISEAYDELVTISSSGSTSSEDIGPLLLQPGVYQLVVDARVNQASNFNLQVLCSAPYTQCAADGLLYDDFSSYNNGPLSGQAIHWDQRTNSSVDAQVICCLANGYGKVMEVKRQNGNSQPDVLLDIDRRTKGSYKVSFNLGVYRNYSAYFRLFKGIDSGNTDTEIFFRSNGIGEIKRGSQTLASFSYKNGSWQKITLEFNFQPGAPKQVSFWIGSQRLAQWNMQGSSEIEALNFLPYFTNSWYLVDGVCLSGQ